MVSLVDDLADFFRRHFTRGAVTSGVEDVEGMLQVGEVLDAEAVTT